MVLNRCMVEVNGCHAENADYEIKFRFEFLDDVYLDWSDSGDGAIWEPMEDVPGKEEFQRTQVKHTEEEAIAELEKKHNHPLMIMVREINQIQRLWQSNNIVHYRNLYRFLNGQVNRYKHFSF